jgi:hypothetical protein
VPRPSLLALCLLEANAEEILVNTKNGWHDLRDWEVFLDLVLVELEGLFEVHAVVIAVVPGEKTVLRLKSRRFAVFGLQVFQHLEFAVT